MLEAPIVSALSWADSDAKVTIRGVPNRPGIAAEAFAALASAGVVIDNIVQDASVAGSTDLTFTCSRKVVSSKPDVLTSLVGRLPASGVDVDTNIGAVILHGAGLNADPTVASAMFRSLAAQQINIDMILTSSVQVACFIPEPTLALAVEALSQEFGLTEPATRDPRPWDGDLT